jgi:hypothetical protein
MKLVNHNGHGVLHKAAQRGQRDVGEWFVQTFLCPEGSSTSTPVDERNKILSLLGPDIEGYCPSDLAGMEGHEKFAQWLATIEIQLCQKLNVSPTFEIPVAHSDEGIAFCGVGSHMFIWEKYGGLRRMRSSLRKLSGGISHY